MQTEFEQASHTYRVEGAVWPSVTQILEPIQELDGIPTEILSAASEFGTNVHLACHLHNQGVLDWGALDAKLKPYVEAWRTFLSDNGAVVIASEQRVYHRKLRYAGCLDAIILSKGRRILVDIKTSAKIPRTVGPQVAAYQQALGELRLSRFCVHLKPEGTYQLIKLTSPADWNLFLSCLNVYKFRRKL